MPFPCWAQLLLSTMQLHFSIHLSGHSFICLFYPLTKDTTWTFDPSFQFSRMPWLPIPKYFVFQEYLFRPEVFPALAFLIHPASADVLTMFRQWVFSTSAVCLRLCVTTKKESEGGAECLRGLWRTWGERNTEVKILWTEHCLCGRKIERWSPVYQICKSVGYNAPWKSFKMKHSVTIMFIPQSLKVWGVTSQVPRCSFKSGREPG